MTTYGEKRHIQYFILPYILFTILMARKSEKKTIFVH
jgi:hypothetical protein